MTDADLHFLRDEVLRVVVEKLEAAKKETLAQVDVRIGAAAKLGLGAPVQMITASNLAAVYIGCAIVVGLAERSAIDPERAIAWALWMADTQPCTTPPEVASSASNTLRAFAQVLGAMTMAARHPDAPSARN